MQLEAAEVRASDERLRHEIGEQAQVGARDRGGRLASEVAAEHREPREDILLLAGEQPPRLVERGAEAAMPLRDVAHRRGEEVDVPLDLVRDLRAREHRHPRGGELDAQGQALDQPADAARLGALVVVEREARLDLRRALDEEAERAGAPVPVLREAEAVHVEHPFALHVETLTRRRQQLDLRCALDDLPQQVRAVDEMLEVVEHEQRRPLAQVVEELFLRREAAVGAVHRELDRLGNRRRQELRRRHRDERDEVHAVRVALDPARGGLERESRLARPARPDEREQAAVGILEQPVDLVELRRAADERRAWGRQVLHARLDRLQQREVAREPVDLELVDALRRAEILEAVHAQVADIRVDERARRLGEEHLPSMADGGDARALVHVDPDVSLLRQPRLTRVQPHAHPDRAVRERALAVRGGGDRIRRAAEGDEERVTLRVHLDALVVGKRRAESPPMLVQCLPVVVAELVQQPRRALDVREQQRHHAGREIARHRTRSWRDTAPLSSGHDAKVLWNVD